MKRIAFRFSTARFSKAGMFVQQIFTVAGNQALTMIRKFVAMGSQHWVRKATGPSRTDCGQRRHSATAFVDPESPNVR